MEAIEIVLIIIGIVLIIISCIAVNRSKEEKDINTADTDADKKLMIKREELEEEILRLREAVIDKTEDEMSRLSNEKIIAVGEYSEQVLEKINHNHEEVVFLYHMMTEKENDLKRLLREINQISLKREERNQPEEREIREDVKDKKDKKLKKIGTQINSNWNDTVLTVDEEKDAEVFNESRKEIIMELYSQGKTIIEISKQLELGQGEVKLVIDLFKQKK